MNRGFKNAGKARPALNSVSRDRRRKGFTLVELAVTVIIMGSLVSMAVPRYFKAIEQANVDLAAANLVTVWTAQRMYHVDKGTYAGSIGQLVSEGLLDPAYSPGSGGDSVFNYQITGANPSSFTVTASRLAQSPPYWSGFLVIDQGGGINGQVQSPGGTPKHVLTPPAPALGL